jgi:glycosyltransferase involved in cell wall biosynthesis
MKVLYDYQGLMQRHGGVSRYFVELISAMETLGGFEAIVPRFFTDNQYLQDSRKLVTRRPFKGKVRIMAAVNRGISLRSLGWQYDVFHPTYFNPYFLTRLTAPLVVTIHDMTHDLFDGGYVRDDGTLQNIRVLCAKAAGIIAVSQTTRNDLCNLLDLPDYRVNVIHHGTSLCYRGEERFHLNPYILYVGERGGYKNFEFLLAAVANFLKEANFDLVCAGPVFLRNERSMIDRLGVGARVRQVAPSSSYELASLYHFASAFCYPSLYEGFGMPLLEAFSCGCPVVASTIPAFREVAGEAAEYFDPRDPDSAVSALRKVVMDPERSGTLKNLGSKRRQVFSWDKAARMTLDVYRSVI